MEVSDKISAYQSRFRPSEFTSHFNEKDIIRYMCKLDRLDITDPYHAPGVLFTTLDTAGSQNVPDLQYPDIYNYLIEFPSCYTGDSLRSYKGLEGYKFLQSGFVMPLSVWSMQSKEAVILTARVHHSQRLNDPQLKPWVMVKTNGIIVGAHCNCMAGFGECCSHVSALLFKLWLHNYKGEAVTLSVTSKKCKWSKPSEESLKKVEYLEGKNIVLNETQRLKKMKTGHDHANIITAIPPLTAEEQSQFYINLSKCHTQHGKAIKPAVLSIIENHAQNYVPSIVNLDLPPPLTNLYDKANRDLSPGELQEKAQMVFQDISITQEQVRQLLEYKLSINDLMIDKHRHIRGNINNKLNEQLYL